MLKFILAVLIVQISSASALSLKVGDVLLKPMDCWSCSLIEAEEETIFSHMGIIIAVTPEVIVAEALNKVRQMPLKDFQTTTEKGQKMSVIRMNNEKAVEHLTKNEVALRKLFSTQFEGLEYDHDFRWNNVDANNREKLYCSEFVAKFLFAFMGFEGPIKRMHFKKNREMWERYFKNNVPDDLWGNSPGDFERSENFHVVGEL